MQTTHCKILYILFSLLLGSSLTSVQAQSRQQSPDMPVHSASFVSGSSALVLNPANIALPVYRMNHELTLGSIQGGLHQGISIENSFSELQGFYQDWFLIDPLQAPSMIPADGATGGEHFNMVYHDVMPLGFTRRHSSFTWGISARTRSYNASYQNDGWYSPDQQAISDRRIKQRMLTFHEIGLGYARPLEMVTGWRSGLNTVILGFNSKFIAGGLYADAKYHSRYISDENEEVLHSATMSSVSTGALSESVSQMMNGQESGLAYSSAVSDRSLYEILGYGAGLDVGMTWVIAFGDDTALAPGKNEPLSRNLRLSVSVNDIGAIYYGDEMVHTAGSDSTMMDKPEPSPFVFEGRPGELHRFIDAHPEENEIYQSLEYQEPVEWVQLPTTLNLAGSLHFDRFMLGADARYQFHDYNYFERGWHVRFTSESTVLRFFPIRSSIIFDPGFNPAFQFGAGLDFGYVDLSFDARIVSESGGRMYLREFGVGMVKIRF